MDEADERASRPAAPGSSCGHPRGGWRRCATPSAPIPAAMSWAEELAAQCWEYEAMCCASATSPCPCCANDEMIAVARARGAPARVESRAPSDARAAARHARRAAAGGPAVRPGARHRDQPGAPTDRPRGARRGRPGRRVARLPRRQPRRRHLRTPCQQEQIGAAARARSPAWSPSCATRSSTCATRSPAGAGLGESLSAYANQVSATSPMAVHVTARRGGPAPAQRRGVRAAADRPGGDGQRAQALRRGQPVAALHGPAAVRRDRGRRRRHPPARAGRGLPGPEDHARALARASAPSCRIEAPTRNVPARASRSRVGHQRETAV